MPSVTPYGEKIQSLRKALGLTQLELALRAGVSERTVRNAERGRSLKREFLGFLAAALGVDFRDLVREPAQLTDFFDWQRNISVVDEVTKRIAFDYDATGMLDLLHPRHHAEYVMHQFHMAGMSDRYMQSRSGIEEAKRLVDWVGEFNEHIVERCTSFRPPAGDGKLVVLRGTEHLKYLDGVEENVWYLHVIEFEAHRVRRWEHYAGPLVATPP